MNWTFKVGTTIANKLPNDWDRQGWKMGYRIVYLLKTYNILATLVVNSDQTRSHIVPTTRKQT
jgi:hypothetical protein